MGQSSPLEMRSMLPLKSEVVHQAAVHYVYVGGKRGQIQHLIHHLTRESLACPHDRLVETSLRQKKGPCIFVGFISHLLTHDCFINMLDRSVQVDHTCGLALEWPALGCPVLPRGSSGDTGVVLPDHCVQSA